jgi:type I restriction enzyme S subunit
MSKVAINRYDAYKDSGLDWLGEVPEHWEVKRIKDLSRLRSGDSIVSEQIEKEGKYPVYGGNGLRGYYSKYTNNGEYILIGRQGALCGNINYASGKFWASEHAVVTYLRQSIDIKWYGEILRIMNLNQYSLAAAQPGLAMDRIRRLLLPVPPLPEQKAIAGYLDTKTAHIDSKIDLLSQKATQYGKLKQSLINETVTRGLDKSVAMKDSGVEWIGEVPEHWSVMHFKQFSTMKGRIGWQGLKHSEFIDEGPFLITGMNFKGGRINWNDVYHISEERYKQAPEIQLKDHDVLMTKDGTIGKMLYVENIPAPSKASLNSHLLVLRPIKKSFYPKYMYYQLDSATFKHYTEIVKAGTTFFGISQAAVGRYIATLPPLFEQKAIADYLNTKTAHIDNVVTIINTQIEKLKELRKTLINDVVTGKIKVT